MNNLTAAVLKEWLKKLLRSVGGLIALAIVLHTHGVTLDVLVLWEVFAATLEFVLPYSLRLHVRL
jgi:hypothetical protein